MVGGEDGDAGGLEREVNGSLFFCFLSFSFFFFFFFFSFFCFLGFLISWSVWFRFWERCLVWKIGVGSFRSGRRHCCNTKLGYLS